MHVFLALSFMRFLSESMQYLQHQYMTYMYGSVVKSTPKAIFYLVDAENFTLLFKKKYISYMCTKI
jgi:hypothetical protein